MGYQHRKVEVDVESLKDGKEFFKLWRQHLREGCTESQKRSRRQITNRKKYRSRRERRTVRQLLEVSRPIPSSASLQYSEDYDE